jgi:hypothetical protein
MNLDEWTALTSDQRNAERAKWASHDPDGDDDEPWADMLCEACTRLGQDFGQHPLINRIDHGAVRILVTTAQYPPQFLEDLPSRYCGFLVEQEPINAMRDHYLRYWRILFSGLLGWPDAQTNDWAMQWDDDLNGRVVSMFYHEDEYYHAWPEIVRESGAESGMWLLKTLRAFKDAVEYRASSPIWLSPVDWDAVRGRVNDILAPHGGQLPR